MAAGFLLGAVIRLVARPARKAGGLNVRSRTLDVVILMTLGVGLLVASATVNLDDPVTRSSVDVTRSLTAGIPRCAPVCRPARDARGRRPAGRRPRSAW